MAQTSWTPSLCSSLSTSTPDYWSASVTVMPCDSCGIFHSPTSNRSSHLMEGSTRSALSPFRRSPRTPKPISKFDPSCAVKSEEGWQLSSVMQLQGCKSRCTCELHGLSEYDVLVAHKRAWILDYFRTLLMEEKIPSICSLLFVVEMCTNLFGKPFSLSAPHDSMI